MQGIDILAFTLWFTLSFPNSTDDSLDDPFDYREFTDYLDHDRTDEGLRSSLAELGSMLSFFYREKDPIR